MLFYVQSILDEHGGTELLLQSWMRLQLTTPTIIYRWWFYLPIAKSTFSLVRF